MCVMPGTYFKDVARLSLINRDSLLSAAAVCVYVCVCSYPSAEARCDIKY